VISNSIVAYNGSGIYINVTGSPSLRNNCVHNPGAANYHGLSPGAGDISVDPQLVGALYGAVHLTAGSPCVDAGDDAAAQAGWVDMDGEPRI